MTLASGESLALALESCVKCLGLGMRPSYGDMEVVCECVWRRVFRLCYQRFRRCASRDASHRINLEHRPRAKREKASWGRTEEEYLADFVLIARRSLDDGDYAIFRCHFLLGADWKACCRRFGLSRGNFFHAVYRIERILGRKYRETRPYGIFPLSEYFAPPCDVPLGRKGFGTAEARSTRMLPWTPDDELACIPIPRSCKNPECVEPVFDGEFCSMECARRVRPRLVERAAHAGNSASTSETHAP